jgi:hypothetical protein
MVLLAGLVPATHVVASVPSTEKAGVEGRTDSCVEMGTVVVATPGLWDVGTGHSAWLRVLRSRSPPGRCSRTVG